MHFLSTGWFDPAIAWSAEKGNTLLKRLISIQDPTFWVSAVVIGLLCFGLSVLGLKLCKIVVNWFALQLARYRAARYWAGHSDEEEPLSQRYRSFTAALLRQTVDSERPLKRPPFWAFWRGLLLQRYIYNLYHIRHIQGSYDRESLSDIFEEKLDRWIEFPRYMAASFILLGLFGTVIGLSRSMEKIVPLIKSKQISDLKSLQDIVGVLLGTVQSMEIALHTTVIGLAATLILSFFIVVYKQIMESFTTKVEEFIHTEVIPALFPKEESQIKNHLKAIEIQSESIATILLRQDNRFAEELAYFRNTLDEKAKEGTAMLALLERSQTSLSRIEGAFGERFDLQLKALDRLLAQTHAAQERLYQGGSQIISFVQSFEESINKQIEAAGKIQKAQEEFNSIIDGYREIMSEIREESKQTLQSVAKQQKTLEKVLAQEQALVDVIKSEKEQIKESRDLTEKRYTEAIVALQHEFLKEFQHVVDAVQKSRETFTQILSEQGSVMRQELEKNILSTGKILQNIVQKTYDEAQPALSGLIKRSESLIKSSETFLLSIEKQNGLLTTTNQSLEAYVINSTQAQKEAKILQEESAKLQKHLAQRNEQTEQILKEHIQKIQHHLETQVHQFSEFYSHQEHATHSLVEKVQKELSPLQGVPSLLQSQRDALKGFQVLMQSAAELSKLPELLGQLSPLANTPKEIDKLKVILSDAVKTTKDLQLLLSGLQQGLPLKDPEAWKALLQEHLDEVKQLKQHVENGQRQIIRYVGDLSRDAAERSKGFFGWFRR